ncbi:hypothetical protein MWN34_11695 [Ancylobacter sp. 6x-1]|uniref:Uncharacterized protein n=1 Tax=Ancylobacter crimeensis TaxID=2579147 RepID=A0ABT0DC96_9HYPH|nr:hypothetical protein [Ancylobacter crimeensis]MCK0197575.1 hypothetical protein [Ancylobacter crimeensis]
MVQNLEMERRVDSRPDGIAVNADGTSRERVVVEDGEVGVESAPAARQSVEVRPMRYVLGIGLLLVIIGMVVAYLSI